jgi:hypothetical protein
MKNLVLLLLAFPNITLAQFGDAPQYIVECPSQNTRISFEIWNDENTYEIRNMVFRSQNVIQSQTAEVINVIPATDSNSFTQFYSLQAHIENVIMTLSDIPGDDYLLTFQSAQRTKEYKCTVGIPKPGVIISN